MSTVDEFIAAVYRKDYDALAGMLNSNNINRTDEEGRSALMHAVLDSDADVAMVDFLISRGADINLADRGQQWSALHFAARDQRVEIVTSLLSHGAIADSTDVFGNTPLWRCVMNANPNLDVAAVLIKFGGDPDKKNASGVSPVDIARNMGKEEVLAILTK